MLASGADALERFLGIERAAGAPPVRATSTTTSCSPSTSIAYCRELLAEALDVHLQATSNRLNQIATRLTVLRDLFVPLTFITGFFGQNFGWMVDHIDSLRGLPGPRHRRRRSSPWSSPWLLLRRAGYLNTDGQ